LNSCSQSISLRGRLIGYSKSEFKNHLYLIDPLSFDGIASSYQGNIVDSAKVSDDGSFEFKTSAKLPEGFFEIVIQNNSTKYNTHLESDNPLKSNFIPVVISKNENIKITADARNLLESYDILNPSPANAEIILLKKKYLESYSTHLQNLPEVTEENLMEQEQATVKYKNELMKIIEDSKGINTILLGIKWMNKNSDFEKTPEFAYQQCERLKSIYANSDYVKQYCTKVTKDKLPLMIGDDMKEYILPMQDKSEKKLGELLGQKLTIVDLWASWCGPCRKENKNILVPLWDKYHNSGLQIIAYGLESSESIWSKAIEKDGADRWLHSSHLQGDESPLFQQWKISTIPANYLLDKDGKIIEKNIHGEELIKFIGENLGE
jgi:thiol-disulfide isomerase/thioredoxin